MPAFGTRASPALSFARRIGRMKKLALRAVMLALPTIIRSAAKKQRSVRDKLHSRDCVVQLRLRDGSLARHYVFKDGRINARLGRARPARYRDGLRERGHRARHDAARSGLRRDHRRVEELQGLGQRAGRLHGLVRAAHAPGRLGRLEVRHALEGRHRPLHQPHQRRSDPRPCARRQDRAHHADRSRRRPTRRAGPSTPAAGASRRAARRP